MFRFTTKLDKIPVFEFSLAQAFIVTLLQVLKIAFALFIGPKGDFVFDMSYVAFTLFALFVIALTYFIVAGISSLLFNKIAAEKKQSVSIYYLIAVETIIFFGIGLLRSWVDALNLALDTLMVVIVVSAILFREKTKDEEYDSKEGKGNKSKNKSEDRQEDIGKIKILEKHTKKHKRH
ncbi:MAG: hypothetical protein Q8O89_03560 [Nanoarchaeota archaeon]|nr:hypothetical protein [Nanoarchaeota archaeon]